MTGSQLPSTLVEAARRIDSVGNYKLTGTVLGKGHFARVEEAIHMLLNVKVCFILIGNGHLETINTILMMFLLKKRFEKLSIFCTSLRFVTFTNKLQLFLLDWHNNHHIAFHRPVPFLLCQDVLLWSNAFSRKMHFIFERHAYSLNPKEKITSGAYT